MSTELKISSVQMRQSLAIFSFTLTLLSSFDSVRLLRRKCNVNHHCYEVKCRRTKDNAVKAAIAAYNKTNKVFVGVKSSNRNLGKSLQII